MPKFTVRVAEVLYGDIEVEAEHPEAALDWVRGAIKTGSPAIYTVADSTTGKHPIQVICQKCEGEGVVPVDEYYEDVRAYQKGVGQEQCEACQGIGSIVEGQITVPPFSQRPQNGLHGVLNG
jgi:hypothetical protein